MEEDFPSLVRQFPAAAEYISSIYVIQRDYGIVTNSHLADWMGVTAAAVSQLLGRLKKIGLVLQKRYGNIELTEKGKAVAIRVLKRHYLLEHLLVRLLDFPWDKADEEAKNLQSQISDELSDHLFAKLGRPQTCPHGNPMPGAEVEKRLLSALRLNAVQPGQRIRILRITEEGEQQPQMLSFCCQHSVRPGKTFRVHENVGGEVSMVHEERTASGKEPSISQDILSIPASRSRHICYESIP